VSQRDFAEDRVPGAGSNSGITHIPSNQTSIINFPIISDDTLADNTYVAIDTGILADAILNRPIEIPTMETLYNQYLDPAYVRDVVRPVWTAETSAQRAREVYDHTVSRPRTVREALQSLQAVLHLPADGIYGPVTERALREAVGYRPNEYTIVAEEGGGTHTMLPSDAELTEAEAKCSVEVGSKNTFRLVTCEGEEVGNIRKVVKRGFGNTKGTVVYNVEIEITGEDKRKIESAAKPKDPPVIEHRSSLQRMELPK
jgi:hypothetical protein